MPGGETEAEPRGHDAEDGHRHAREEQRGLLHQEVEHIDGQAEQVEQEVEQVHDQQLLRIDTLAVNRYVVARGIPALTYSTLNFIKSNGNIR